MAAGAAISLVGMTSLLALRRASVKKGDEVLIIGVSGACGMIGLMLAKHLGARVTGVCSSSNSSRVKSLGADEVIEYDVPSSFRKLEGMKFDMIYDTVTSPEDPDQKAIYKPFLKNEGNYVAINSKRPTDFVFGWLNKPLGPGDHLISVYWKTRYLEELSSIISNQQGKSMIDKEFNLSLKEAEEAFTIQKSRRAKGKLVFRISS
jgi:NADPH:quinone reductase-like Zn-dependent oxidoreductase